MHVNYYFLKYLTDSLNKKIQGYRLVECYCQNKDELIMGFVQKDEPFYIKVLVEDKLNIISFPRAHHKARKNVVSVFKKLEGCNVTGVYQFENDRSFSIQFINHFELVLKFHGSRSNIILSGNEEVKEIFKNALTSDQNLKKDQLNRDIDQTYASFLKSKDPLKELYPTFGPIPKNYLLQKGYSGKDKENDWKKIQKVISELNDHTFYITEIDDVLHLSLLKIGKIISIHNDPLEAANDFYFRFIKSFTFSKEKKEALKLLITKKRKIENYINKTSLKLTDLFENDNPEELADIIMANLNKIPEGTTEAKLYDFYKDKMVNIKLKSGLSPQKNAEHYYKKSKNRKIEISTIEKNLNAKKDELILINNHINELDNVDNLSDLRRLVTDKINPSKKETESKILPFKTFIVKDYQILIGKNAKKNDELTLKYAKKNDLWLHAKDVAGSHVVVKNKPGKNFPKDIIEKAAQLAGYYSKNKNEGLTPVIYTSKKFVRKRKGSHPGEVIVDKEQVIMVKPAPYEYLTY